MVSSTARHSIQGIGVETQYAKLTIDDLNLLIPQQEVQNVESVQDVNIETEESFDNSIGILEFQGEAMPVFCFNGDLTLTQVVSSERKVCVVINAKNTVYSILCDRIAQLEGSQIMLYPVPECMSTEDTPILSITMHDNDIACIVSSDSLYSLIQDSSLAGHDET